MLDAHPDMSIPPETHFFLLPIEFSEAEANGSDAFVDQIISMESWPDLLVDEAGLRREAQRSVGPDGTLQRGDGFRAFYETYAKSHGKNRWGDKSPDHTLVMDHIYAALGEAHFLHVIRDGRDVACSIRNLWFAPGNDIAAIAATWVNRVESARAAGSRVPNYREIRYEELVRDSPATLRTICDFIKLDYNDKMLTYFEHAARRLDEVTDRFNSKTGELIVTKAQRLETQRLTSSPPDRSRIDRWRTDLSVQEHNEYLAVAGDLLEELGYPTT